MKRLRGKGDTYIGTKLTVFDVWRPPSEDRKNGGPAQGFSIGVEKSGKKPPDRPGLDRRYEASLEKSFDRTLSQFERMQRIRLGQPVQPQLKVRHKLS